MREGTYSGTQPQHGLSGKFCLPTESHAACEHVLDILGGIEGQVQDPVFDRVVRFAAQSVRLPAVSISLASADKRWIQTMDGMMLRKLPHGDAFCGLVIDGNVPLVVEDTLENARTRDNPYVTGEPHLRAYAGFPIRGLDGRAIGALCALDTSPHVFTQEEQRTLSDLAEIVSSEIRLHEATRLARTAVDEVSTIVQGVERQFHDVFECAGVGIALVGPQGEWLRVNDAFCQIAGHPREALLRLSPAGITHPEDLAVDVQLRRQIVSGEISHYEREKRYVRKDGEVVWIGQTVTGKKDAGGRLEYFIVVVTDIQARKDAEEELSRLHESLETQIQSRTQDLMHVNAQLVASLNQCVRDEQTIFQREAELALVIENAYDAYIGMDHEGRVTTWNHQAEETFGWSAEEAKGQLLEKLIIPESGRTAFRKGLKASLDGGDSELVNRRIEMLTMHRNRMEIPVEIRIRALRLKDQMIFSAFLHDITERRRIEAEREHAALHDTLTGLFNRRALFEVLPAALARMHRTRKAVALLFIDLDGFKQVNDSLGHQAGDALLRLIGTRLMQHVRQTDTLFRLGGDEFTVVLEGLADGADDALALSHKLLTMIQMPWTWEEVSSRVDASIGIAVCGASETCTPDMLLSQADAAMYAAKEAGKGRVRLATP